MKLISEIIQDTVLLVIDEISQQAPWHIAKLSNILQLALGNKEPFGGIPVIFLGDFGQKDPVRAGDALPTAIAKDLLLNHYHKIKRPNPKKKKSLLKKLDMKNSNFRLDHPSCKTLNLLKWTNR